MVCRARFFGLLLLLVVAVMAQDSRGYNESLPANISFVDEFTITVQPPSPVDRQQAIIDEMVKAGERLLYPIVHFFDHFWENNAA